MKALTKIKVCKIVFEVFSIIFFDAIIIIPFSFPDQFLTTAPGYDGGPEGLYVFILFLLFCLFTLCAVCAVHYISLENRLLKRNKERARR